MLAIVARGAIPYELFEEFADLADKGRTRDGPPDERGHKEGWGVLCFSGADIVEYSRGSHSARGNSRFAKAARSICQRSTALREGESLVVLAHVRRSSEKETMSREEFSHPFLKHSGEVPWGFQHNGGIKGASYELINTLDSLYLFDAIVGAMRGETREDVERAYGAARAHILDRFEGFSSLTSILANGDGVHCYREATVHPDYYALTYEPREELAIVCSEPILGMGGRALGQGEFLHVPAAGEWPR
jgi:predicted glutamine amidotransferase